MIIVNNPTSALTRGTAVTASGVAVDFTGLPSWVKRISVSFNLVSTNGSSPFLIQIGSGSVSNTGYTSQKWTGTAGSGVVTNGFDIGTTSAAANSCGGIAILTLVNNNLWVISSTLAYTSVISQGWNCAGSSPALSGALDRVRITTVNGTDSFDAGTINILYD